MDEKEMSLLQKAMSWIAVCLVTGLAVTFFGIVCRRGIQEGAWIKVTQEHFAAIVGLPAAAVGALFLVLVLRMTSGPIEVELGTLKFKGAAAPIVFWLFCFLAMATAIKMVW
jgi:hypothetical protein